MPEREFVAGDRFTAEGVGESRKAVRRLPALRFFGLGLWAASVVGIFAGHLELVGDRASTGAGALFFAINAVFAARPLSAVLWEVVEPLFDRCAR